MTQVRSSRDAIDGIGIDDHHIDIEKMQNRIPGKITSTQKHLCKYKDKYSNVNIDAPRG